MTAVLVIPPVTALILLALWGKPRWQAWVSLAGVLALFAAAARLLLDVAPGRVLVWAAGGWPVSLGIAFAVDRLSASLVTVSVLVGVAAILSSRSHHDDQAREPAWHPLVHLLLWAVCGAFMTGDLFNLFVWFEVMLMASFTLIALGGGRERLEGAVKYVAINLVSSVVFLSGCGILYGVCGTLNMAALSRIARSTGEPSAALLAAAGCLLAAFLLKSAAFPLFAWLPASYHTAAPATAALFSALLTKVGVYAVLRLTVTVLPLGTTILQAVLFVLALATMAVGVLGAATQMELKRILAFHIVSQVGYMLLAVALGTPAALAAAVFYLVHHILVKSNLFLVAGLAAAEGGSEDVRALGALRMRPALYAGFLISAASLAGLPPLSGFFAKLATVKAAFEAGEWVAGGLALAVGFLTLYSMVKIHREAFAKEAVTPLVEVPGSRWALSGILLLAAGTVVIGLTAGRLWRFSLDVGQELAARTPYVEAVLGGGR
ncbi:MAG: Na+/H+ antiporter subunit D [Acidobacteria bacterium]|nr:Na+/H+ antiporter subunit D [Acidobacteriota bacterium]MCG3191994.1 Na(+)/H(+) antiporter subunit D [Thermoanaerobaculia bacterium]MCK6683688.1 Na+/H+ antiporter subunit D [Thermoanaerobaculia bacterium]